MLTFLEPHYLVLLVLLIPILIAWRRRQPVVQHSGLSLHSNLRSFSLAPRLPVLFFIIAWSTMVMAIAHPALPHENPELVIETRDIAVAVDISSSMDDTVQGATSKPGEMRKIDLARASVYEFVRLREGDRIALLVFNESTLYHWPLTRDQAVILDKIQLLTYTSGGTNFEGPGGSSPLIGPLQASLDHFGEYGQAQTKIIVLVTDGEASIGEQRLVELAKQFEVMNVRLYVIGVGQEWTSGSDGTRPLRTLVAAVHGVTLIAGNEAELRGAMLAINAMERSHVKTLQRLDYSDFYQWFVVASLVSWLLFLFLNAATRRTA